MKLEFGIKLNIFIRCSIFKFKQIFVKTPEPNPDEVTTPSSQIIPWKLIESSGEDPTGEDLARANPEDPAKADDSPAKDPTGADPEDPSKAVDPTTEDSAQSEDPRKANEPTAEDTANAKDPTEQTAVDENLENYLRSTEIGAASSVLTEAGKRIKAKADNINYPHQNTEANIRIKILRRISASKY